MVQARPGRGADAEARKPESELRAWRRGVIVDVCVWRCSAAGVEERSTGTKARSRGAGAEKRPEARRSSSAGARVRMKQLGAEDDGAARAQRTWTCCG